MRHRLLSTISISLLIGGSVYASSGTESLTDTGVGTGTGTEYTGAIEISSGSADTGSLTTQSGSADASGGTDDSGVSEHDRTIHEINAFLINSYKHKFDAIFATIRGRFSEFSPERQVELYHQISLSVAQKLAFISSSDTISKNRREVLSSVLTYIQYRVDEAATDVIMAK